MELLPGWPVQLCVRLAGRGGAVPCALRSAGIRAALLLPQRSLRLCSLFVCLFCSLFSLLHQYHLPALITIALYNFCNWKLCVFQCCSFPRFFLAFLGPLHYGLILGSAFQFVQKSSWKFVREYMKLQINLGNIAILTRLNFLIDEKGISFHLLRPLISSVMFVNFSSVVSLAFL